MTDYADPVDVVLYDIDGYEDIDSLIALTKDPERRWYARARLASLAARGLVAAIWNPKLHPRGRDGKFIEVGKWVRWFNLDDGLFYKGKVESINPDTGNILVNPEDGSKKVSFAPYMARSLTSIEPAKAKLNLPDPKMKKDVPGFVKVGGQGGSNPGGKYKVDVEPGPHGFLSTDQFTAIADKYGLTPVNDLSDAVALTDTGRVLHRTSDSIFTVQGAEIATADESSIKLDWYSNPLHPASVDDAWNEMSTISGLVKTDDEFYVKHGKSPLHVSNELLANRLYELAGVNVADTQPGADPNLLASRIVPFDDEKVDLAYKVEDAEALGKLHADFVVDAWLANWDVAGLNLENVQYVDGEPYRIDAGGALLYRAQGAPKGSMFGSVVGELDSLRDPNINAQSAKVFGGVQDSDLLAGAMRVASISPEKIHNLVEADDNLPDSLADTLIARRQYIIDKYGIADPFAEAELPQTETSLNVDTVDTIDNALPEVDTSNEITMPDAVPEPAVEPAKQTSGLLWSSEKQAWGPNNLVSENSLDAPIEDQIGTIDAWLKSIYDNKLGNIVNGQTIHDQLLNGNYAGYLVVDPDGRLRKITAGDVKSDDPVTPSYDIVSGALRSLHLDEGTAYTAVPIGGDATDWGDIDTVTYTVALSNLRDLSITRDVFTDLPDLYDESHQHISWAASTEPLDRPEFNFKWRWQTPTIMDVGEIGYDEAGTGHLYQKLSSGDLLDLDTNLTVNKYAGPQALKTPLGSEKDHGYSHEVVKAIVDAKKLTPTVDDEKSAVDPSVIAEFDKKLDAQVDLPTAPSTDVDVDSIELTWHDAAVMVSETVTDQGSSFNLPEFAQQFPQEQGGVTVNVGKLKAWLQLQGFNTDHIDSRVLGKSVSTGDLGDPPDDAPGDGKPTYDYPSFPHVNSALKVSANYKLEGMGAHDTQDVAGMLVGKVVAIIADDLVEDEDGNIVLPKNTWSYGASSQRAVLAYVESWDGNVLKFRSADGTALTLQSYNMEKFAPTIHVLDNVTGEDMKQAGAPTLKANGDIVSNGHVVGAWEKVNTYHSTWYDDYEYKATIFPEYSITGKNTVVQKTKKTDAKTFASALIIPTPPVAKKTKKSSTGSKKVADAVVPSIEAPPSPDVAYVTGEKPQLGDWVASVKGGGGFVGKVVGWPHQEKYPGLVFAVDKNGVQKAIKISGTKKVNPGDYDYATSDLGVGTLAPIVGDLPNAYTAIKLSDGKTPQVGQLVKAGKPGGPSVTGVITNINPKQGFIYIQTSDGKTVSKTASVVSVEEEPQLYWDFPAAATAATLKAKTTPAKHGPKKPGGPSYPAEDGSVIEQSEDVKQAWLAANPKRKLSKDGYAPQIGMIMRNAKGETVVIHEVNDEWAPNPNGVKVWNLDTKKSSTMVVSSLEVDHALELSGIDGKPVPKVHGDIQIINPKYAAEQGPKTESFPDGSTIYRFQTTQSYYIEGKYRTFTDWAYFISPPIGDASPHVQKVQPGYYNNDSVTATTYLKSILSYSYGNAYPGTKIEKVGIVDNNAKSTLTILPVKQNGYNSAPDHSEVTIHEFHDAGAIADTELKQPIVSKTKKVKTPLPPEGPPQAEPEVITVDIPAEPPVLDSLDDTVEVNLIDPVENPPTVVPQGSIVELTPPPQPPKPKDPNAPKYPDIPEVTNPDGADLTQKPKVLAGTKARSLAEAAKVMLAQKDEKTAGSGSTYAIGDSDYVEDMAFRYNVEVENGVEKLVVRFRLREDVTEDTLGKMLTAGGIETGAWKLQGNTYPKSLKEGDAVAVRIASQTKVLKPDDGATVPNARVIGKPVLIGKSPVKWKDPSTGDEMEVDLYRVKVQTENGAIGEVDMQHRPGGSIHVYEYDPDAPKPTTGVPLTLTPIASDAGWKKLGKMSMPGNQGQIMVDETGKANYQGMQISSMAKGTGGYAMQRTMPGGSSIRWNSAHSTEGGIGFDTTRRAVVSGEVRISVPIEGKPEDEVTKEISQAMQLVGVPVEKQGRPTDKQLVDFALAKLVTNYHPTYTYRDKPINGPTDPRVTETLTYMSKKLKPHLKRDVTLDDLRIHTDPTGRMRIVLSPEVAKAMGKSQGNHHFHHHGVGSDRLVALFSSPQSGLMATDERWSVGVMTTGMSSHSDMTIGSGDRIYMRANKSGSSFPAGSVIFNPMSVNTSTEVYTKGVSDDYGRRSHNNLHLTSGGHIEYMYKRKFEPEQITFYVVGSEQQRDDAIKQIKARGVTHVGSRPIEEIIVTGSQAAKMPNFDSIGEDFWKDDIPITTLLTQVTPEVAPEATAAPAEAAPAAPVAASGER